MSFEGKLVATSSNTSKLDSQQMVHWFVISSYASGSFTEERVKNSIALLKQVPSARYAVLHRFTMLFEEVVRAQLDQLEYHGSLQNIKPELMTSIDLVVKTLLELLTLNAEAWAPILCTWSVESLGQISSCYKQRQIVPPPSNLPRLLMFWLNTAGMRMLLDIYRTSLKHLIERNTDTCVDSLLLASSNHSPYFDWVVADIGNAFPSAIIERVLYSGFNKFCKLRWTARTGHSSSSDITMNENEQSVLTSVIRILEHLMEHHKKLICLKMLNMFKNPLDKDSGRIKAAYFLMHVFTMSSILLQSTTKIFVHEISGDVLNSLLKEYQRISKGPEEFEVLCSLVVHLICQSNHGSYQLISMFIDGATSNSTTNFSNLDSAVKVIFSRILPSLQKDLHHLALSKTYDEPNITKNALTELKLHYVDLCSSILSNSSVKRKAWFLSLLQAISYNGYASVILSHILVESKSAADLQIFLSLYRDVDALVPGVMEMTIYETFQQNKKLSQNKQTNCLKNIYHLLSQSSSGLVTNKFVNRLKRSLCLVIDHIIDLLGKLSSSPEMRLASMHILYVLLSSVSNSKLCLTTRLLPLARTIIFYFFKLLHTGYVNNDQSMQSCHRTLVGLSQTRENFQVVSKFLLEAAVAKDNQSLFGHHFNSDFKKQIMHEHNDNELVSLLSVHRKLSAQYVSRRTIGGFVPISVETGVIGEAAKKKKLNMPSETSLRSNNESISLVIYRCCCKTAGGNDVCRLSIPDAVHAFDSDKLALLSGNLMSAITSASSFLATTITLDGDLEWPPCHMKKFTIERDLTLFHFLQEHPFVWQILFLLSHNYKALWELSPVLRSCMSVLLTHYESSRYTAPPSQSSVHYQFAVNLVEILHKGQLLPAPLCYVSELFHHVTQYEVFVLLSVMWNFIKDHPPPLDMEQDQRDFLLESINLQPYLSTVHTVVHANISKLGHLFSRFTLN